MPSRLPTLYVVSILIALGVTACDQKPVDLAPEEPMGTWRTVVSMDIRLPSANALWASDPENVWVAFSNGVEHYDGHTWSPVGGAFSYVGDIWGTSSTNVYAANGGLWRHDGTTWVETGVGAVSVHGSASSDVYALGLNIVTHFNGAVWDTILVRPRLNWSVLWSLPGFDCAVVDDDSLLRWNGSTWVSHVLPGYVRDVWAADSDTWYAVGTGAGFVETIWHWDGDTWTPVVTRDAHASVVLRSIWGSSEQDIYAVGTNTQLIHYDGNAWTTSSIPTGQHLEEVGGSSSSDVYVVGREGAVLRYDGASWQSLRPVSPADPKSFWPASSTKVFVGGAYATVYESEGTSWQEDILRAPVTANYNDYVYSIAGTSATNVFASTGESVFHYDGLTWTATLDSLSPNAFSPPVRDMWALPSGEVFTAGEGSHYFDGESWTHSYEGSRFLNAVWACAPDCAYVVGDGVLRFDGTAWRLVLSGNFTDVWGSAGDDVYVVHQTGMQHFDGQRWAPVPIPTVGVQFVSGYRGGVIAVGGYTLQFEDSLWRVSSDSRGWLDLEVTPDGTIMGLSHDGGRTINLSVWVGSQ